MFKFWGDNVDKQRRVRDLHSGQILHMFSMLVCQRLTTAPELRQLSQLDNVSPNYLLPKRLPGCSCWSHPCATLAPFSKVFPKHIPHKYSAEMCQKSDVVVLDVFEKNEANTQDMVDIMTSMQEYLGESYPDDWEETN